MLVIVGTVVAVISHYILIVKVCEPGGRQKSLHFRLVLLAEGVRVSGEHKQGTPDAVTDNRVLVLAISTEGWRSKLQYPVCKEKITK